MSGDRTELPIRPAATVIVLRDSAQGMEVLLVQRATELAFHGGAWVFPGGRVDPEDHAGEPELGEAVARRAAVREAFEESGLSLQPDHMRLVSHWTTPAGRPRRFATWFFATLLHQPREVVIDGGEIRAHRWLRAADALELRERGELELPPPTFVTLTELAAHSASASWFEALGQRRAPVYVPRPHVVLDGVLSLYHGDVAYEDGQLDRPGPRHRLHMTARGWRYEVSPL